MKAAARCGARPRRRRVVLLGLRSFSFPGRCFRTESWLPVGYSTHL